eukprot:TRINITY_DN1944_c0_g2_i4.p1 TRINITY_DN1944_c0_g2~~TRINITY_DN1944_c0_g2_i4.p1  ORF type:complete len:964 (+),score=331.41 TRINITY_DN1944_c0_g2_i4:164-3055(+)
MKLIPVNGKEPIKAKFSPSKARANTNAIAATLYDWLFQWIVKNVSDGLKEDSNESDTTRIGVLDIFGFEFTGMEQINPPTLMNSFEQFCINLCNEQLQNKFQNDILESERKTYKDELNIDFTPPFPDNLPTLQLCFQGAKNQRETVEKVLTAKTKLAGRSIDKSFDIDFNNSMLTAMKGFTIGIKQPDGKIKQGKASPDVIEKPGSKMPKNGNKADPYWSRIRRSTDKQAVDRCFKMQHYAGEVYYDTLDWCTKNNALLAEEVNTMLAGSATCFPGEYMKNQHDSNGQATILEGFTADLRELMYHLDSSACTFVRCIKSNTFKARGVFQGYLVLNQLRYTGMMDALRIRKLGWPFRLPQDSPHGVYDWMDKYARLYPHKTEDSTPQDFVDWLKAPGGKDPAQKAYADSWESDELKTHDLVMVGKSMVFMKDDITLKLDEAIRVKLHHVCLTVQSAYRAADNRINFSLQKKCAGQLGPVIDGVMARNEFMKKYHATYETQDRHEAQEMINGSVQRQKYYERKVHYAQMQANVAALEAALEKKVIATHEAYVANMEADAAAKQKELARKIAEVEQNIRDAENGVDVQQKEEQRQVDELKARAEQRATELEEARAVREGVRADNAQKMIVLKQQFDEREREWQGKKKKARDELEVLQKQIPILEKEHTKATQQGEQAHAAALAEYKADEDKIVQQQVNTMKQMHEAEQAEMDAKHKAEREAEAGEQMLASLDEEDQDLVAQHEMEVDELSKSLRSQNWKLAQLHMSEQKTASEFESLGLALPSNTHDQHAQGQQVDVLDSQMDVLRERMAQSQRNRDELKAKLEQLQQLKDETQASWEASLREQDYTVNRLEEALDKERKVSIKLEQACSQPGPARVSRFDVQTAPPPSAAPQTFVSNTSRAPQRDTAQRQTTTRRQEEAAAKEEAGKEKGLSSLSALYQGHGTVHVSQLEKLDSATLGAALRLLH